MSNSSGKTKLSFEKRVVGTSGRGSRDSLSVSNSESMNTSNNGVLSTPQNCVSSPPNPPGRGFSTCVLEVLSTDPPTVREGSTPPASSRSTNNVTVRVPASRKVSSVHGSSKTLSQGNVEGGNIVVNGEEGGPPIPSNLLLSAFSPSPSVRAKPPRPHLVSGDLVPLTPNTPFSLLSASEKCTPSSRSSSGREIQKRILMGSGRKCSSNESSKVGTQSIGNISPSCVTLPNDVGDGTPLRVSLAHKALIGKGSFGVVFQAMNRDTNQIIAVKEIAFTSNADSQLLDTVRRELTTLKLLDHPHIVKFLGGEWADNCLRIYLEYVSGGSISSVLRTFGPFQEKQASRFTRQMLEGLAYLHSKNIIHRDLKGDNLLVDPNGTLKISDFGTAKSLVENQPPQHNGVPPTPAGTAYFMAPEAIVGDPVGLSSDIWSVGCCVIEMLTGSAPFSHMKNQYSTMLCVAEHKGELVSSMIPKGNNFSSKTLDFLMRCLQRDPEKRSTALELLEDPWIQNPPEDTELSCSTALPPCAPSLQRDRSSGGGVFEPPFGAFNDIVRTPKFSHFSFCTEETSSLSESKGGNSTRKSSTKSNRTPREWRGEKRHSESHGGLSNSCQKERDRDSAREERRSAGGSVLGVSFPNI
ncbi:protein kinase, putative [Trypanosoma equiperdum]|uniref:Protein kinase, putative n=2 Tax=Trypanozoon TaxID=39700 RepID=C9ZSU2_TRYB9|nr:protein kinase, putative [Trypanosoma brucei gambiense DAL972]CBH12477.1 protein kinase, putative [Trypanosoma brucei gambiense DAL972]SCU67161.1 protein kinase, putative [Trypanosoma equiperdum]|eukprot:XP_011774757.1 protein kinase, putative [Trypanosoma brucei gambiense DAL972]